MKSGRKNGKRFAALLLTLAMTVSLGACGNGVSKDESTPNDLSMIESSAPTELVGETVANDSQDEPEESSETTGTFSPDEGDIITGSSDVAVEEEYEEYKENEEPENDELTAEQRNSINMLNYMTALTQSVNAEKGNQLFLESAYDSFDNLYPNAVDMKTQAQITNLMDTIQNYRMISAKKERLEYIYEQNRAQAMREAIPNPVGLLSAVQSGSLLKAAASVLYMAVDSKNSYEAAKSQADSQFIKDGWELDDAESAELHNSTKNTLTYLFNMVRDYDLPGDYALNREDVEEFVFWSAKPDSQLVSKISWFESHQSTYSEFGAYWLEVAKDYYNYEEYDKCLEAIRYYESVTTRIFRKDIDYATALPMAIISAKETMNSDDYVGTAEQYCSLILSNTKDADWTLRYFAAQIYMDIYSITKDAAYLDKAYKIAFDNVVVLADEQRELNAAYLTKIQEVKADKDATKREKEEVKSYNKALKKEQKIALPPISEALYLNCDLLFALAEERNISSTEQKRIESVLHVNGERIFLTQALDNRFWFSKNPEEIKADDIHITFKGKELTIPAICVTERSTISVTVSGANGATILEDWTVDNVKRPKNADSSEFTVTFNSKDGKNYKYQDGETVTITVTPVEESPEKHIDFTYKAVAVKRAFVFNGVKFERVTK